MLTLTDTDISSIIKKYFGKNNSHCDILRHDVSPYSDSVVGYLGEHSRLRIELLIDKVPRTISFFTKTVPSESKLQYEFMTSGHIQVKEAFIYEYLLPQLMNGHNEENHWSPICYMSRSDLIVLEDLSAIGYRCVNRYEYLNYEHLVLALKTLAKFHSTSLIVEEKKRNETGRNWRFIDEYPTAFTEMLFRKDEEYLGHKWAEQGAKANSALLENLPDVCEKSLQDSREGFSKIASAMYDAVKPSQKYRNVICHGDLWLNNIMFQYDGDKPVRCCFVDYQALRYNPPALDVLFLLYISTSSDFRKEHMDELLRMYYEEFKSLVTEADLNVDTLLPLMEFQRSCESLRGFVKFLAAMYLQLICLPEDLPSVAMGDAEDPLDIVYFKRVGAVLHSFKNDLRYTSRITDIMNELRLEFSVNRSSCCDCGIK